MNPMTSRRSHQHHCSTCEKPFECQNQRCEGLRTATCRTCLVKLNQEFTGTRSAQDVKRLSSGAGLRRTDSSKR